MGDANYDKSGSSTRRYRFDLVQRIAVGAASAPAAEINDAIEVQLTSTVNAYVTVKDSNPAVVVSGVGVNALPLPAWSPFVLQTKPGDEIAVIRAGTEDGVLYINPIDGRDPR
ncbi:hypothetical protein ACETK8_15710 [Brevundimonas staleyi]|uniref:Uncharacterized protein n=1 Tax=Brevundimonas staleyi TaxID=74326 RepID=A0ABW0FXB0_9CAUL